MSGKRIRWIAALLAAALGLTACSRDGENRLADLAFVAAPNYLAEDLDLPEDTGTLFGSCTDGNFLWYLMAGVGEDAARLCRADLAGGQVEALRDYQPPEAPEGAQIRRYGPVLAPDGTLWVYEEWLISRYDLPEDFNPETDLKGPYFSGQDEFLHLSQLDPETGKQKKLVDLSEAYRALELGETFGAIDFAVDGEDRVYLAGPSGVAVLDGSGKHLFTLESEASNTGMTGGLLALLPDGRVAAGTTRDGKRAVRPIDAEAQDWAEDAYPLSGGVRAIFAGREPCLFYYILDDVIYGVVAGEPIPQRLLPLANTQLDGYSGTECFALLDGGRLALIIRQIPDSGRLDEARVRLVLLTPTDQLPESGKVKLVYGAIGNQPYIKNRIEAFNKASDTYYIEYHDYTESGYETADSLEEHNAVRSAARLRLAAEIAAGRAPDIMDSTVPLEIYAGAGYLEDLWPWIDNDPEISRDKLMTHVLECAEKEGKLYTIGGSFTIETAVASRTAAGDRTGWTLEEMMAAYGGTMPDIYWGQAEYLYKCNAEDTLWQLLVQDMGRYVDWETGECRFDSDGFKDLLRLAASSGNGERSYEPSTPLLWEGKPVLCKAILQRPKDLVAWDIYFGGPETLTDGVYEEQLWDAGVLDTFISEYNGRECTTYQNAAFAGAMQAAREGVFSSGNAAGAAFGMPDRELYASFAGTPTGDGTGSSFVLQDQMAVSASSQAKEGAWAFVRSLLLPGGYLQADSFEGYSYTLAVGFPINRSDFEALLEPQWCRVDGDGEIILDRDGQPIEAPVEEFPLRIGNPFVLAAYQMAPTRAQMGRFWNLYNAIDHVSADDRDLMQIIQEQARAYFAGDKSLAETASQIQSRASLYVNENQ